MRVATKPRPTSRKKPEVKETPKQALRTGVKIQVADLRVGDLMVLNWHAPKVSDLTDDEMLEAFANFREEGQSQYVNRTAKVESIDLCEGRWRTHVHVNRGACYDIRSYIWVVE